MTTRRTYIAAASAYLILSATVADLGCDVREPAPFNPVTVTSVGSGGAGGEVPVPEEPNLCACMLVALEEDGTNDPCLDCHLSTVLTGEPCDPPQVACETNTECIAVRDCVATCDDEGIADLDCLRSCMLPAGETRGKALYNAWIGCMCEQCASVCDAYGDAVCEPLGTGGAGGSATGGAGGSATGGAGGSGGSATGGSGAGGT